MEALRDEFEFLACAFCNLPLEMIRRPPIISLTIILAIAWPIPARTDNDTTCGWFASQAGAGTTRTAAQIADERAFALMYLGTDGSRIHWDMIRLALASVADTASIVPLQDVLGLGTKARMNLPGSAIGNWRWRFTESQITPEMTEKLANLTDTYDRTPRNAKTGT